MGRKGMKGFIKAAAKRPGEDEEEEEEAAEAVPEQPKQQQKPEAKAKAASKPAAAAKAADEAGSSGGSGDEGGSGGGDGPESRGHMLQRHKREILAHKKALQRSGKKSKDDVAKATAAIEKRHADELRALDAAEAAGGGGGGGGGAAAAAPPTAGAAAAQGAAAGGGAAAAAAAAAAEPLSKYMKGLGVDDAAAQARRPSKAQKRREKHAAQDAEREARIAAEKEALGTPERLAEEAELKALLAPLGLGVKEIRADGHCMYRSVEDQLRAIKRAAAGGGSDGDDGDEGGGVPSYQELRELAAEHLRAHRAEFAPYLVPEDEGEDPGAYYDRHCDNIEITAAWGGHVELQALSGALGRRITVYAVGMAPQVLGEALEGEGLTLCFLRHAYGLGEHYNSTKRLLFAPGAAAAGGGSGGEEEEEEEGDGGQEGAE